MYSEAGKTAKKKHRYNLKLISCEENRLMLLILSTSLLLVIFCFFWSSLSATAPKIFILYFLFNHTFAGHLGRLGEAENFEYCRCDVGESACFFELAVIAYNAERNGIG